MHNDRAPKVYFENFFYYLCYTTKTRFVLEREEDENDDDGAKTKFESSPELLNDRDRTDRVCYVLCLQ